VAQALGHQGDVNAFGELDAVAGHCCVAGKLGMPTDWASAGQTAVASSAPASDSTVPRTRILGGLVNGYRNAAQ
jgi:hypothetical protein